MSKSVNALQITTWAMQPSVRQLRLDDPDAVLIGLRCRYVGGGGGRHGRHLHLAVGAGQEQVLLERRGVGSSRWPLHRGARRFSSSARSTVSWAPPRAFQGRWGLPSATPLWAYRGLVGCEIARKTRIQAITSRSRTGLKATVHWLTGRSTAARAVARSTVVAEQPKRCAAPEVVNRCRIRWSGIRARSFGKVPGVVPLGRMAWRVAISSYSVSGDVAMPINPCQSRAWRRCGAGARSAVIDGCPEETGKGSKVPRC